jgi:hypothetical protein
MTAVAPGMTEAATDPMLAARAAAVAGSLVLCACASGTLAPPPAPAPRMGVADHQPPVAPSPIAVAGAVPEPPRSPAVSAPTWSAIYARYLGPGTAGACGRARACHADVMTDAGAAYRWLARRGYIAESGSALVSPTNSCLRWFGGNMPPRGRADEDAVRDLTAWANAGAADD